MNIQLRSDQNDLLEFSEIEKSKSSHSYELNIRVRCKEFLCTAFELIDHEDMNSFIGQLNQLIEKGSGNARLNTSHKEWFIELITSPRGKVFINGHLKPQDNWLEFSFSVDSLQMPSFIQGLSAWQSIEVT